MIYSQALLVAKLGRVIRIYILVENGVMMIDLWRRIKAVPYLREPVASVFYRFYGNRRMVVGKDNLIRIDTQNSLPRLKNTRFDINGDLNTISIDSGVRLSNTKIEIRGSNNQLVIKQSCSITNSCLWLQGHNCKLSIGKSTTIQQAHIGAAESQSSVEIGEDCMFAHGIDIRSSDSHSILDLQSKQRINPAKNIYICDHVWLAANVQILKGVVIGSNSVVAAGSIVTKDVPENSLVAGIPAQVKRSSVTWLREQISVKQVLAEENDSLLNLSQH